MLDLEPIKAREAKATPGPWVQAGTAAKPHHTVHAGDRTGYQIHSMQRVADESPDVYKHMKAAYFRDAEFIAGARQDVPNLIAEVERLRKVNDAATGLFNAANHYRNTGAEFDLRALDRALNGMCEAWGETPAKTDG